MPDAATLQRQFNAVCYFLAIVYVAMGIWCAVQLIRFALVSRVWTRQKIAHVLVFLLCASRAAFFCVVPGWGAALFYTTLSGGLAKAWLVVLNELPSLLIISTFSMQLLMWADSYHSGAHSLQTFKWRVRPTILGINAALYVIQIAVWAGYEGTETHLALELSVACAALHATVFVILAAFLGCYARLIITQHGRTAGIPLRVRQRQTCTIAGASTPISIAFVVRAIAILIAAASSYTNWRSFNDESATSLNVQRIVVPALFALLLEVAPLAVLMHYNRRPPVAIQASLLGPGRYGGGAAGGGSHGSSPLRLLAMQWGQGKGSSERSPLLGGGGGGGTRASAPARLLAAARSGIASLMRGRGGGSGQRAAAARAASAQPVGPGLMTPFTPRSAAAGAAGGLLEGGGGSTATPPSIAMLRYTHAGREAAAAATTPPRYAPPSMDSPGGINGGAGGGSGGQLMPGLMMLPAAATAGDGDSLARHGSDSSSSSSPGEGLRVGPLLHLDYGRGEGATVQHLQQQQQQPVRPPE